MNEETRSPHGPGNRSGAAPSIRAARAEDVETIRAVVTSAYEHYTSRIGRRPAPMDADHEALVAQADVWVAETAVALMGVIVLLERPDHVLVSNLAVAPEAQGGGVGRMLLEFAETRARRCGYGEVRLYTNAAMVENLRFYRRRGYTETYRGVDDGFDRVHYRKTVGPGYGW